MKNNLLKISIFFLFFMLMISNLNIYSVESTAKDETDQYDDLRITVETDKERYKWIFEPIIINITIENVGEEEIILDFPTTKHYDFSVHNTFGFEVYKWSENKYFSPVFNKINIFAGEKISYSLTWNQMGHYLWFMPYHILFPGRYEITGSILSINNPLKDEVEINISL